MKVIFFFLLQGAIIFALSFTHRFIAVAATGILLSLVLGIWISRDILIILSRQAPRLLEEDDLDFSQKIKVSDLAKKRELEESEQERVFIASTYATMKKEIEDEKNVVQADLKVTKQEKEDIQKIKENIETIVRSVPDGVATLDSERKIVTWNPGAATISGWDNSRAEKTLYKKIFKLFDKHGTEQPAEECPIEECFRTGHNVERGNLFLQTRSGSQKPIEITVAPTIIEDRRNVRSVVVTFRDISKKWEVEKFKEEFLAMVTHDLKSPLAAIVGYTNLLLHPKAKFSQEEQNNFLTSILGSVKILQFLIDNILESSRLESGRINYQFEDFDLGGLMQEIEVMFTPIVNSKHVKLEFSGSGMWVHGDREKLREVINNLISNAVKFTPEDGKIKVTYTKLDTFAEIKVADTGKGIPAEELPKLFNKFVQVKGEKRGTGLGLYIVKRILEDHGQKIEVKSTVGRGTEFTFTLKMGKAAKEAPPSALPRKMEGRKKGKVLIVEDNAEVSNLIRYYLRAAGYETKQVFQGGDVPGAIEKEKPDLITLDYDLPDINGEEVIKRLNKVSGKIHIPIMIITGNIKKSWEIEYDCLLYKPVDETRFLREVDKLINRGETSMKAAEVLQ